MKITYLANVSKSAHMQTIKGYNEKLCISSQKGSIIIKKSDIGFLKSDGNYCQIHLQDATVHLCAQTMKEIYGRIQNKNFIKVHNSYVINVENIKYLNKACDSLILSDGTDIPIARARKKTLKELIRKRFD